MKRFWLYVCLFGTALGLVQVAKPAPTAQAEPPIPTFVGVNGICEAPDGTTVTYDVTTNGMVANAEIAWEVPTEGETRMDWGDGNTEFLYGVSGNTTLVHEYGVEHNGSELMTAFASTSGTPMTCVVLLYVYPVMPELEHNTFLPLTMSN